MQYVQDSRINEAKRLIIATDLSLLQIAEKAICRCGFWINIQFQFKERKNEKVFDNIVGVLHDSSVGSVQQEK